MRAPGVRICFAVGCIALASCMPRLSLFRPQREVRPNAIGVVLPMSGKYRLVGEAVLAGITLALNGSTAKLIVRDSAGEPATAAHAVEELAMAEGVIAILGGTSAEEATAAAKRAHELWVPFLTFSKAEGVTSAGDYVFQMMPTPRSQAKAMGEYASCQLGQRTFAVLAPDSDLGRELASAFGEAVSSKGGTILATEKYAIEQTSFTAEARKLTGRFEMEQRPDFIEQQRKILEKESDPFRRRKAIERVKQSLPPQVGYEALFLPDGWKTVSLIAPAFAAENLVTAACDKTQLQRISKATGLGKLHPVTLLGWGGWSSPVGRDGTPELLLRGGKYLQCSIYLDAFFDGSSRPATREFVDRFRAAHAGQSPNLLNAIGYDSALLFQQIIERGSPADSSRFRDLLAQTNGFDGATWARSFNPDREAIGPLFIMRIDADRVRELPVDSQCRISASRTAARPAAGSSRWHL